MHHQGIIERIITSHLTSGAWQPGSDIEIRIDQTLTQDATGTMAFLQYEAMGAESVKTELSVSYVDHNTVQSGFENADDHAYLQSAAARFGVKFSRPGNGICHQVHLERFGKPGRTLLGSDSHTPTGGGIGMLAIGAGGLDVALAMAGQPFALQCPHVCLVRLTGRLSPWVSAKDVILRLLKMLTSKGNVGTALEYGGPGVRTLSVPERATIANMGAELGVTASVFPSDNVTRSFLKAQGRLEDYTPLKAAPGASYSRVIELDLSQIEPLVAAPHNPDNVKTVRELAGMAVQQVCIGSCTNSSYKDLMLAAHMLAGKKVAPGVSLVVAPGSRQVLEMIARNGALANLISAGARIAESACGFCIGNSHAPCSKAVSIRTSNRNFLGRSGTKNASIYLASVETAAAAAVAGKFTDPRDWGDENYPVIKQPRRFIADDAMIIEPPPPEERQKVELIRGPNIGKLPRNTPPGDTLAGIAQIKVGDKVTTDHIMPAGAFLKLRSNVPKYAEYVFHPVDPEFPARCKAARERSQRSFIIAGESYGQGSSREHAALCPMFLGVAAVAAKSFERIHTANLINCGILPLIFKDPADYDRVEQGDSLTITGLRAGLERGELVLQNITRNIAIPMQCHLNARERAIILAGGRLNLQVGATAD